MRLVRRAGGRSLDSEQVPQAVHLVVGQGIHRINDDCRNTRSGILIAEAESAGDYGIKETLRLT